MPAALPFSTSISQASQAETTFRIIETKYGNGYSQRAGDGINSAIDSWNVAWENIDSSTFASIIASFNTAGGTDYFTWQPQGDATTKKWVVKKFTRTVLGGSVFSISATLEQVFDL